MALRCRAWLFVSEPPLEGPFSLLFSARPTGLCQSTFVCGGGGIVSIKSFLSHSHPVQTSSYLVISPLPLVQMHVCYRDCPLYVGTFRLSKQECTDDRMGVFY